MASGRLCVLRVQLLLELRPAFLPSRNLNSPGRSTTYLPQYKHTTPNTIYHVDLKQVLLFAAYAGTSALQVRLPPASSHTIHRLLALP